MLGDGHVVTWGRAGYGGDSAAVQEQLRDVQHISSTLVAFAAVLGNGRVVTWDQSVSPCVQASHLFNTSCLCSCAW